MCKNHDSFCCLVLNLNFVVALMLRDIFYEENTQNSYLSVRITRMKLLKNTKNKTRQDKDKDDNKGLIEDTLHTVHCTV